MRSARWWDIAVLKILQSVVGCTFVNPFFAVELENLVSNKLIMIKFPAQKASEADVSSVRPSSSLADYITKLTLRTFVLRQSKWTNAQNVSFVVFLGWKFDPDQPAWYLIFVFNFPNHTAAQILQKLKLSFFFVVGLPQTVYMHLSVVWSWELEIILFKTFPKAENMSSFAKKKILHTKNTDFNLCLECYKENCSLSYSLKTCHILFVSLSWFCAQDKTKNVSDTLIHSLIDRDLTHNWFNNYLNVEDKTLFEKLGLGLGLGFRVGRFANFCKEVSKPK